MLFHAPVVVLAGLFAVPAVERPAYVIEPPDVLRIDVTGLPRKGEPVTGERLVRPDGTVSLGGYGSVSVVGKTPDQAQRVVIEHLAAKMNKKKKNRLGAVVEVAAFNSKVYYVLWADQVFRLPCTGSDTVLDAISQTPGMAEPAAKGPIWVARPGAAGRPTQVLPVDWKGITREGVTATNYQLLPGDRLFVGQPLPK